MYTTEFVEFDLKKNPKVKSMKKESNFERKDEKFETETVTMVIKN